MAFNIERCRWERMGEYLEGRGQAVDHQGKEKK